MRVGSLDGKIVFLTLSTRQEAIEKVKGDVMGGELRLWILDTMRGTTANISIRMLTKKDSWYRDDQIGSN